jgi:hypothetical protein
MARARSRFARSICLVFPACILLTCYYMHLWNRSYVDKELEAPLDHLTSNLWKPLYGIKGCPDFNHYHKLPHGTQLPPLVMISARPKHLVDPVLETWTRAGFQVAIFNTTQISRDYRNLKCHQETFKSRLFAVYQEVFQNLLQESNTSKPYFAVTMEDDVKLLDATRFRQELAYAYQQQWDYYSFTKNSRDPTCLYQFGTTAQLWSQRMMRHVLQVNDDIFCRLPIDMFVAQQGPWYVTQHQLVQHVGTRLIKNP